MFSTVRFSNRVLSISGIVLSILTVLYLALALDWHATYVLLLGSDIKWFCLGFVFFVLNYLLRTLRFTLLYGDNKLTINKLSGITFIYGMFNYILPAKTGELFYILLAKFRLNIGALQSTSVIIVARLFDILAVFLFILFVIFYGSVDLPQWAYNSLILFELTVVLLSALLFMWLNHNINNNERAANTKFSYIKKELLSSFRLLHSWSKIVNLLFLAIAIWICIYANFYCIVRGLGFEADLYQIIMISVILIPLTLLPQGIANLGTHEIAWVGVFQMFGVKHQDALQIAFGSHVVLTLSVILLGVIGTILIRRTVS